MQIEKQPNKNNMNYKYTKTYKSGAQQGLEQKMQYWKLKDVLQEFNILTAQAYNCYLQDKTKTAEEHFMELIRLRQDEQLREMFEKYKDGKKEDDISVEPIEAPY